MRILIFTQGRELLDMLREQTKGLFLTARQEAKIISYHTRESAFNEFTGNHSDYDLLVLDIDYIHDLKQVYTGFRIHNLHASIILISSSYKLLDAAMLLRPSAYLKKPISPVKYKSRVQFIMNEYISLKGFFSFKQKQRLERIPCSEIEYFESSQRNATVYLKSGKQYTFPAKLDDIQGRVPGTSFVRCHQSYIVNMENVRQLDKVNKQFQMVSGGSVDISRRNMSEVQEAFDSFINGRR